MSSAFNDDYDEADYEEVLDNVDEEEEAPNDDDQLEDILGDFTRFFFCYLDFHRNILISRVFSPGGTLRRNHEHHHVHQHMSNTLRSKSTGQLLETDHHIRGSTRSR